MKVFVTLTAAGVAAIMLHATGALAETAPETKCQASKNKIAGQYYACREKAEAKAIMKGLSPDYGKCLAVFTEKWTKAEMDGAGACPDNDPLSVDIGDVVAAHASETASLLAGTVPPPDPECGDNAVNVAGEQCDGTDLGGLSCETFGRVGTLACTAGCELDASGCTTCPVGTTEYLGNCWLMSAVAGSCDTACAGVGMVYSSATALISGSSGSDANCVALLDLLGMPGGALDYSGNCPGAPVGCAVNQGPEFRSRCATPATTSAGTTADVNRVCACE